MASSDLVRWGGLAAMGAGVVFIVYSLLGVAVGNADEPSPLDILAIFAYVLLVVGLLGFHALQGRNYGRIGRAGLYTTIGAIVLFEFLILTSLLGGDVGLGWLLAVAVFGHAGRTGAVRCGYSASEGVAALGWHIVHHTHARHDPVWDAPFRSLPDCMARASLGSAGVRALVAEQRRSRRTTFARKLTWFPRTTVGGNPHSTSPMPLAFALYPGLNFGVSAPA